MARRSGRRVGKIEFLRFCFCMMILCYHTGGDYKSRGWEFTDHLSFFNKGFLGVEFFFLVSGFLTAMAICKVREQEVPLGSDTWKFMEKKISSILPYHVIIIILTFLFRMLVLDKGFLEILIKGFPSLFFLQMSGYQTDALIGVEWYISAMLLALAVIYPLARRHYDVYVRIVAPLAGFLLTGMLIAKNGTLGDAGGLSGFLTNGVIRAFAEISLGMFVYEAVRVLKQKKCSPALRFGITVLEILLYVMVVYYSMSKDFTRPYLGSAVIALTIATGISFSGISYGSKLFDHRFFYFLGKISLPVYLVQNLTRDFAEVYLAPRLGGRNLLLAILIGTILAGIVLYGVVTWWKTARSGRLSAAAQ